MLYRGFFGSLQPRRILAPFLGRQRCVSATGLLSLRETAVSRRQYRSVPDRAACPLMASQGKLSLEHGMRCGGSALGRIQDTRGTAPRFTITSRLLDLRRDADMGFFR